MNIFIQANKFLLDIHLTDDEEDAPAAAAAAEPIKPEESDANNKLTTSTSIDGATE